jgi:hypothetical protein
MEKTGDPSPADFRPFARIARSLPDDLIEEAVDLLFLVREYGISKSSPPFATAEAFLAFVAHVHDGWKIAQRRIATRLREALSRRADAKALAKSCRGRRDSAGESSAKLSITRLELEIKILRRTLDVILWSIVSGEHSTLRRLFVAGGAHSLSVKAIADAMPTAGDFNRDPHTIALCTDMLSQVHVGDLMVANRRTGEITFVELKAGDKNYQICKAAEVAALASCAMFEGQFAQGLDPADTKHYERAKRQSSRNHTILNTIRNEGGTDPNTGAEVKITTLATPPELWCDRIMGCYQLLNENETWAIATIDKCVFVGVYSNQDIAFVGFKSWMAEIKCESPIYNLTDSFHIPSARPLGATFLSFELQTKILRGEILVIICLDIPKLIDLANEIRPGFLSLATRAVSGRARQFKMQMLEHQHHLVRVSNGTEWEFLGGGFRDRVVFDQQRPLQLIRHHPLLNAPSTGEPGDHSAADAVDPR